MIMRKSAYIISALLLMTACNKELMEHQKMGSIDLSLSSDVEVVADTKTGDDEVDCSGFLVDISGTTFLGQAYASEQYVFGAMPDVVTLPYGYYHVTAQSCLESAAEQGFGCVRYYGVSDQVDVLSQTPAQVTVACHMVNGKVTMTFDDSFLEDFSDVTVDVRCTRSVSLTSEQANAPTEVYFNLPSEGCALEYTIYGTVAKGTENEKRLSYSNSASAMTLLPAKWAKITIKSNHNGVIGPGVNVDGEMGGDAFTEIINPEDGETVVNGAVELPTVQVDTEINGATVIDCVIDIYQK